MIDIVEQNADLKKLGDYLGSFECFKYQSHLYVIIRKTHSQNAVLEVSGNRIPCINLRSGSIRAICVDELVEPVDIVVNVCKR